jgi:hypothetical protein
MVGTVPGRGGRRCGYSGDEAQEHDAHEDGSSPANADQHLAHTPASSQHHRWQRRCRSDATSARADSVVQRLLWWLDVSCHLLDATHHGSRPQRFGDLCDPIGSSDQFVEVTWAGARVDLYPLRQTGRVPCIAVVVAVEAHGAIGQPFRSIAR